MRQSHLEFDSENACVGECESRNSGGYGKLCHLPFTYVRPVQTFYNKHIACSVLQKVAQAPYFDPLHFKSEEAAARVRSMVKPHLKPNEVYPKKITLLILIWKWRAYAP